jgi:hypothetical protein
MKTICSQIYILTLHDYTRHALDCCKRKLQVYEIATLIGARHQNLSLPLSVDLVTRGFACNIDPALADWQISVARTATKNGRGGPCTVVAGTLPFAAEEKTKLNLIVQFRAVEKQSCNRASLHAFRRCKASDCHAFPSGNAEKMLGWSLPRS